MRNTLYRQMVYWINAHRTWIEVAETTSIKNISSQEVTGRTTLSPELWSCGRSRQTEHTSRYHMGHP